MTARVPVFVPETEAAPLTFNQGIFEAVVQVSVPVPVFVIVSGWLAGAAPFCTAEKVRAVEFSPIVGIGAAVTVKVTEIFWGVFVAPDAVTVSMPL